jgi:GntR family transcriptional regulator
VSSQKQDPALYSIVKEKISDMFQSGQYRVGDQIPTEASLCDQFDVSRTTVRIALQQLELEGRIERVRGKGTFVARPKIRHFFSSHDKGFAEQMIAQGLRPESRVEELLTIPATATLAEKLGIEVGDPVNKLSRVRSAGDEPLLYEISYMPWKLTPGLANEDCSSSLYKLLKERFDIHIHRAVELVEPILADGAIARKLQIAEGTPVFYVETSAYIESDVPIEFAHGYFRGDRSKFVIERIY